MPRKKLVEGYTRLIERTKLDDVPTIELAKSIIEKDPILSSHIPMLVDKAGINEFKLKNGFRELFRTSSYLYRLTLCLEKAKILLEETDDTSIHIASKVGFDPYSGFSTTFRKAYQMAPRDTAITWRHNINS